MSLLGCWNLPVALAALVLKGGSHSGPRPGPRDTIILRDGFESGDLSLWAQLPDNGRYSLSANPARRHSGTRSLQVLYTPANTYGMLTRWFMPGYDEVYVKFYVMFEEAFENPGMHFFVLAGNRIDDRSSATGKPGVKPDGADFFYAGLDPEYDPRNTILQPFHFYTYWPDMTCSGAPCYGNRFYQSSPKAPLIGGQWHELVFHIKLNTPGESNGSQTLWVDGVKKIDVQSMRWRTTSDLRLNQIRFDNWMASGAPRTERIWVDDVTVWRPGRSSR
jgi:polysaccharide lyase-like protein